MFRNLRGVKRLMIAELIKDDEKELTYGTPVRFAGVKEIGDEPEESTGVDYYDNQPAIIIDSEGDDKYKLVTSVLDDKVRAIIEGREYDEETGAYYGTPKEKPYVAIGFVGEDTDGQEYYYWIYKAKLTGGGEQRKTKDNGTDSSGLEWEAVSIYTTHTFEKTKNKPLKFHKLKAGGTVTEEAFFKTVYTPDTAAAAMRRTEKKGEK